MIEEYEELIKSCCENFKKADEVIREVKLFTTSEAIPAVLQLRYAGWHLVKFLADKKEKHLYEAKVHSNNAVFESYRYGILFCFKGIEEFRNEYGKYILPHIIPDYSEKMRKLEEIKEKIYKNTTETEKYHFETLSNAFSESKIIFNKFIALQPELNKMKNKKWKILKIASILLPIIAMIVTIILK